MKPDKGVSPKYTTTDLSALAEAFLGVRPLVAPSGTPPRAAAPAPLPTPKFAPANPTSRAPLPPPAPAAAPLADDATLLREAMRGVRRLDGPVRPAARATPTLGTASPPTRAPAPVVAPEAPPRNVLAESLAEQLHEARATIAALEGELRIERAALAASTEALADARASVEPRREEAPPSSDSTRSLREIAVERGLLGDDELVVALRAIFDARRGAALLDQLVARDAVGLEQFFAERLLLVGEGEVAPQGRVAVVVAPERSELREDSAIRKALSLFSTACLVQGKRRIVFVGGSPAYRRQLKEGLDRRLDVRFVEGDQRRIPRTDGADLVIIWGGTELDHTVSAHFPDALVIQHRGITRMLELAAERISG